MKPIFVRIDGQEREVFDAAEVRARLAEATALPSPESLRTALATALQTRHARYATAPGYDEAFDPFDAEAEADSLLPFLRAALSGRTEAGPTITEVVNAETTIRRAYGDKAGEVIDGLRNEADERAAEGLLRTLHGNARYIDAAARNIRAIVGFMVGIRPTHPTEPGAGLDDTGGNAMAVAEPRSIREAMHEATGAMAATLPVVLAVRAWRDTPRHGNATERARLGQRLEQAILDAMDGLDEYAEQYPLATPASEGAGK